MLVYYPACMLRIYLPKTLIMALPTSFFEINICKPANAVMSLVTNEFGWSVCQVTVLVEAAAHFNYFEIFIPNKNPGARH